MSGTRLLITVLFTTSRSFSTPTPPGQRVPCKPGSLAISSFNPSAADPTQAFQPYTYGLSPAAFLKSEAASDFTFLGGPGLNGMNPNIQQPYTESWNLGIQRQVGQNRAFEIRYVGSRTERQWLNINPNEINIFGTTSQFPDSFLTQFKNAQTNLAINQAQGVTSFANNGYAGQQPTPIFDAAFAGESTGGPGVLWLTMARTPSLPNYGRA